MARPPRSTRARRGRSPGTRASSTPSSRQDGRPHLPHRAEVLVYSLQCRFMPERLGSLEQLLLLALLRLGDDAYGVPIRDEIEERTGRVISPGAIYTALDRLETRGLVRSRLGEPTPE